MIKQKRPVVVARILGGIGNQLFIYGAARRLAIKNKADLVLDHLSGFAYDEVYKRHYQLDHFNIAGRKASSVERLEPASKLRRYIKRYINKRRPYTNRNYIYQDVNEFDSRLLDFRFSGVLNLEGYWQGVKFFEDVQDTIRQELTIKPPLDSGNLKMAGRIREVMSVAIHVRFFDDPKRGDDTSIDFYNRAIQMMESQIPDAHYFVFSDRPEEAAKKIDLPSARMTLVKNNVGDSSAYADLWLMTLCRHFIIANSTFSWWGAWLSESVGKKVIAPIDAGCQKKSSTAFNNILLDEWTKC